MLGMPSKSAIKAEFQKTCMQKLIGISMRWWVWLSMHFLAAEGGSGFVQGRVC